LFIYTHPAGDETLWGERVVPVNTTQEKYDTAQSLQANEMTIWPAPLPEITSINLNMDLLHQ